MKNHYSIRNHVRFFFFFFLLSFSTNNLVAQCGDMFGYSYYTVLNGQATQDCPNVYSLVANSPTGGGNPLNELLTTKASALNVRGSEAVTPEMKWTMQYHLYRHLSDNTDEMARDNSLKDFYRNASNTSIGKFYKIEKTFKMAHDVAKTSKKRLEDNVLKHHELMEQYLKLDTFSFISKRDKDKTVNGQKMNQIRSEMNKIARANQDDLTQIEKEKKAILRGSLQTDIATVGVTLKPEINEKAIADIYLDLQLNDKTALTESQQRIVTDIANQCPKVGGDAVFKARTLYQMIESKLFIDDDKNCEQVASLVNNDIETIKAHVTTKEFGVYPNPASDFIQLDTKNATENGEWLIINAMGKVAVRYQQTKVNADIRDLPTGVYFVSYRSEGVELFNSKFVKAQ
jgi:Secretion system C-terminal sorting domain